MPEVIFPWRKIQNSNVGNVARPVALIELRANTGEWKSFEMRIDSASPITLLNQSDCEELGYPLKDSKEDKPIQIHSVVLGHWDAHIRKLDMRIGEETISARVGFTVGGDHERLLGRLDVFDNFRITFSGKNLRTSFLRE
ncbi:MAG: hypothetical protein JRN09_07020 [Nitrososphaerota archaeon]|nr:hypothetical protein [Nitrososphaerota archaeon]